MLALIAALAAAVGGEAAGVRRTTLRVRLQRVRIAAHGHWGAVEDAIVDRLGDDPDAAQRDPILISFAEMHFYKGGAALHEPWAALIHDPISTRDHVGGRDLLSNAAMLASLPSCGMLFVLAAAEVAPLERRLAALGFDFPVRQLQHPYIASSRVALPAPDAHAQRVVIQIGYWLRRTWAIFALDVPNGWQKEILPWDERTRRELTRSAARDGVDLSQRALDSVLRRPRISDGEYGALLAGGAALRTVVLLDVYAATASNVLLECIHAATPLLVRRVAAFEEALGESYPLFFDTHAEAASMLREHLLVAAVKHLRAIDLTRFHAAFFLERLGEGLAELEARRRRGSAGGAAQREAQCAAKGAAACRAPEEREGR
jgi:hypothetical protein